MIVNAQAIGIADIGSVHTPMSIKVLPLTNEMVWMPLILTEEVDLGIAGAPAIQDAYLGTFVFEEIAAKAGVKGFPIRLVTVGSPLRTNVLVRGDSPAQTIPDLKGGKHATFREGTHFQSYNDAQLANGGLSSDDIIQVPVSNPIESAKAVMEGRADSGQLAVGAPIATEAVAKVNARWLPLDPSPEAVKRMQEFSPSSYVALVPGGVHIGVPEPMYMFHVDFVLVAREGVSEAAIYELTKALWEQNDELQGKPALSEWTTDKFLSTVNGTPYHEGAIKYYKEIGVWTTEMEAFQKAILARKP